MYLNKDDIHHMRHALALARRGLGRVWPNPAVGCVIVDARGDVAGRGWTGDGGRPHAEVRALAQAGAAARGGTAYVSLEPCCHHGKTPPCTDALIAAGVARVVAAFLDPDPRVAGGGIAALRAAGIEVATGVLEAEAIDLNRGFILRVTENRPFVTLKTAISIDGKIAPEGGKQQWITGSLARRRAHLERSLHDAILIGADTALADNPLLTTRLDGYEHHPVRVVLDTHLRLKPESALVRTARDVPLLIFHQSQGEEDIERLYKKGVELFTADPRSIPAVLRILAQKGITRLLVEGGARIHTSFLEAGLCDAFLLFRAPHIIGAGGVAALRGHDIDHLERDFGLVRRDRLTLGEDLLEIYAKAS